MVLGGGQIGAAVGKAAPQRHEVIALTRRAIGHCRLQGRGEALADIKADWVINAAAYTAVDRAEDEPQLGRAVNDTAVGVLAGRDGTREPGCCIYQRISCSTAHPDGPICRAMPPIL